VAGSRGQCRGGLRRSGTLQFNTTCIMWHGCLAYRASMFCIGGGWVDVCGSTVQHSLHPVQQLLGLQMLQRGARRGGWDDTWGGHVQGKVLQL
jgi:hypothetical protein